MLLTPGGERIVLSPGEYTVLAQVLAQIRGHEAVRVVPYDKDLTTQQAAEILNISRQYLVTLLERGEIPYTRVGTHRRVRLQDVLDYQGRRSEVRRESLARLARASVDMGDYWAISMAFVALLDANVLVNAPIRDVLLRAAESRLYRVTFSNDILEEMRRALEENLGRTRRRTDYLISKILSSFGAGADDNRRKSLQQML